MPLDADYLADRRLLRRKLTMWRAVAFGVAIVAVAGAGIAVAGRSGGFAARPQIARVSVSGFIAGDRRMTELFRRIGETPGVRGVVVSIDSPGGTTAGSEELFRGIRSLADKKPLVAFVDGLAASGGYITALAADHIVARETALVGSIGVLFQYPDVSRLLDRVGVSVGEIKSSPLKAEPSGLHPPPPEAVAALRAVVDDTFGWFKGLVQARRGLSGDALAAVSDGRVFSARQGLPLRLVDELGAEDEAVAWLEREKAVPAGLPVQDWRPRGASSFSLWTSAGAVADLAGLDRLAGLLRAGAAGAARTDGLLALWQPGTTDR